MPVISSANQGYGYHHVLTAKSHSCDPSQMNNEHSHLLRLCVEIIEITIAIILTDKNHNNDHCLANIPQSNYV